MTKQSLIIIDYGVECWKQHGITDPLQLRSWLPTQKYGNPVDCQGNDTQETLDNLGPYFSIASTQYFEDMDIIANTIFEHDSKFQTTSGGIYWFDTNTNELRNL